MVFREGSAGRPAAKGWIRADRTTQPSWALPAEAIVAVLPVLVLASNFPRGTIGPTATGTVIGIPWAAIAAVNLVSLRR